MRNGWMKFMWPTWPMVGRSSASPVSTRFPPWRPATQWSPSRAWLSAKIRSTLTWRTTPVPPVMCAPLARRRSCRGLPLIEQRAQSGGIGGTPQAVAKARFGKHLGELREELQVLFGRVFRHQEHEHLGHGLAIRRVEGDG